VSKASGRANSRARPRGPGRLIVAATRWAVILWTGFCLFFLLCLIDIVGLRSLLADVGPYWLAGMSVIVLAATTARLTMWVGWDVWNGLRTETEALVRSLNPSRWAAARYRNSGLWDAWLDVPAPGRDWQRNRS
jgi:hypothetical protein